MVKLIAIDLDGTLLDDHKEISQANKDAVQTALAQGVEVAIATGRPLEAIQHLLDQLGLNTADHYSLTYNGGLVIQNYLGEAMTQRTLPSDQVTPIAQSLLALDLPVVAVGLDQVYEYPYPSGHPSNYHKTMPFLPFTGVENMDSDAQSSIFKLVVATEADHLASRLAEIPEDLRRDYSVMQSHPHQLEIMPKGVDKGQGLSQLAKLLGIPQAQVMAIGDEENDLAMLQWAGIAVAMGNARSDVKAIADYVTASNQDSGVAQAIRHFLAQSPH